MSDPVARVVQALEMRGSKIRRNGDSIMACCPAHPDSDPSLHVSQGKDGRALIHCFSNCTTEAILSALGLRFRDLFIGVEEFRRQRGKSFLFDWRKAVLSPYGPDSPTTRLVLVALSMHANQEGGSCYPSEDALMEETGLCSRSIVDHLRLAELHGWIVRWKRLRGRDWSGYNYLLDLPIDPGLVAETRRSRSRTR